MKENNDQFWNKAMQWGLFMAVAFIIITSIFHASGNMFSPTLGRIKWIIYIAGIILVTKSYKQTLSEESLFPYGKALGLGVATSLFASLIMAVYFYVLYKFIDTDLINQTLALLEETLLQANVGDDMTEEFMSLFRQVDIPTLVSMRQIPSVVFNGFIIALFSSIFLKKKNPDGFSAAMNDIDDDNE